MISIIIPTFNGLIHIESCLSSLAAQTYTDVEIIVVDNASTDGTVQWIQKNHPSVHVISLNENMGFCGAVNRGISAAAENDVILLNNDTYVSRDWLLELVDASEKFPQYSLFTSKVLRETPGSAIDTVGDGYTIAGFGYKIGWMEPDDGRFDDFGSRLGASGCSIMIRKQVLDDIGWFDESFFAFGEDSDFCLRALLAGYRCLFVPRSRVVHKVRGTATPDNTFFWYHRNSVWIVYKNFPWQIALLAVPNILLHWLLTGFSSVRAGRGSLYIKSLWKGIIGIHRFKAQRRKIQASRQISLCQFARQLTWNWPAVHIRLHRASHQSH